MEIVFWLSVGAVFYVCLGYPLLLAAVSHTVGRPPRKQAIEPFVSMLVAAYDEADVIGAKIRNALELDYPEDRLEIVIASDGSRDGTAGIVRQFTGNPRVRLFEYPVNRGKVAVLNDTVPELRGDIIALTDASSMLARDSLRALVSNFADPEVGAVSGLYRLVRKGEAQLGPQEGFYWRYETFLRVQEAALGSSLGAHGALYAIRKELYPYPPPGTINDDYVIPMRILQKGFRVVYEPAAVVSEDAREMSGFGRRVRIMAGTIRELREIGPLLYPLRPLALFCLLSHRACRVALPWFMLLALCVNAMLLGGSVLYRWLAAVQGAFYGLALAGVFWRLRPRLLMLPYFVCMMNAAGLMAIYYVWFSRRGLAWR